MGENGESSVSCQALIICIGCRAVLDEQAKPPRWGHISDYISRTRSGLDDFVFLESFCSACHLAYDRLIQYR